MAVSIEQQEMVKKLCNATGRSIFDCQVALQNTNYDYDKALELLHKGNQKGHIYHDS